jgi:menaquinone-dependent protoporphyrinogen oxidase
MAGYRMATVLIAYATAYGHTERIAARVADWLWRAGHTVNTARVDQLFADLSLAGFDAVVVAAPVRFGRHLPAARRFVRRHAAELNAVPSAFISVSGAASDHTVEGDREAARYVAEFLQQTGWHPQRSESVGGELAYTRYGFVMRRVIRHIAAKRGRLTDMTRDYDGTDWATVDRLAGELAGLFAAGRTATERRAPLTPRS